VSGNPTVTRGRPKGRALRSDALLLEAVAGGASPARTRRKHTRPIVLEDWQRASVDEHPWAFLRGRTHSNHRSISISHRRSVALIDGNVGAKG
jgi:hypothetical protein